jgi:hypothetical protein
MAELNLIQALAYTSIGDSEKALVFLGKEIDELESGKEQIKDKDLYCALQQEIVHLLCDEEGA